MRSIGLALAVVAGLTVMAVQPVAGQDRVVVTVPQLFNQNHRLEVLAGSEVVWADPHFERVWFPTGRHNPKIERVAGGFRAKFDNPGTYRGAFTITGGTRSTSDVYDMVVVVKPRDP